MAYPLPQKDWDTLLHFIYRYRHLLVTNYLAIKLLVTDYFSACRKYLAENHLSFPSAPHWVRHSYLSKRATIDPLHLWVIKWNLVRKHLYSVLKFIVTCYYGKQSFEGFVRGIFTSTKNTKSCPSTYCTY